MLGDRSEMQQLTDSISSGETDDVLIDLINNASKSVLSQQVEGGGFEYSILTELLIYGKEKAFWHLEKKVGLGLLVEKPLLGAMEDPLCRWSDIAKLPTEADRVIAQLRRKEKIHSILTGIAYHTYFEERAWNRYETLLFYAVYFGHTCLVRGISELGIFLHKEASRHCSPVMLAVSNQHTVSMFKCLDGDLVKYDRLNNLLHRREYFSEALKLIKDYESQYKSSLKNEASTQINLINALKNILVILNDLFREENKYRNPVIELSLDDSEAEQLSQRVTLYEFAEHIVIFDRILKDKQLLMLLVKSITKLLPRHALESIEIFEITPACKEFLEDCIAEKRQLGCTASLTSSSNSRVAVAESEEEPEEAHRDYSASPYTVLKPPTMPSGYYNLGGAVPTMDDIERMEEYNSLRQVAAQRLYNNLIEAVNNGLFRICLTWDMASLDSLINDIILFKRTLEELLIAEKLMELPKLKNTDFLKRLQFWCSFRNDVGKLDKEQPLDRLILYLIKINVETPKTYYLNNVTSRSLNNEQKQVYFEIKRAIIALKGSCSLPEPSFVPGQGVAYKMITFAELNLPNDRRFVGRFAMGCVFENTVILTYWHSWLKDAASKNETSKKMLHILMQNEIETAFQDCMFSGLFAAWKTQMPESKIVKWVSSTATYLDDKFGTMVCDIVYDIELLVKHLPSQKNEQIRRCQSNLEDVFKNLSLKITVPSL